MVTTTLLILYSVLLGYTKIQEFKYVANHPVPPKPAPITAHEIVNFSQAQPPITEQHFYILNYPDYTIIWLYPEAAICFALALGFIVVLDFYVIISHRAASNSASSASSIPSASSFAPVNNPVNNPVNDDPYDPANRITEIPFTPDDFDIIAPIDTSSNVIFLVTIIAIWIFI
jgi:hypothetical protein